MSRSFFQPRYWRKLLLMLFLCVAGFASLAQIPLTTLPSGGNKKAFVSEWIGLTEVSVSYSRPGLKGRAGQVWGQLVHTGFQHPGFGSSQAAPWRAGANENTVISFSSDVLINGQSLPKGSYGFFIAYYPDSSILIFSRNYQSWGHYYYNPSEDALRVKIVPEKMQERVEWLRFEFSNQREETATLALEWEQLRFPFEIKVDYVATQLESFRNELRTERGFIWQSWEQAAAWCAQRNVNLEQALQWADSASSPTFGGDKMFSTFLTRADILERLGRGDEAAVVIKSALPKAAMQEVHMYGRRLLQQKKAAEALEIFLYNHKTYPNEFTTLAGLTRGYAANNDAKKALKYAKLALPLAPNDLNKQAVQAMIEKLEKGNVNL